MSSIEEKIILLDRGKEYGTVAAIFENEDAATNCKQVIEGMKWSLLPSTSGKTLIKISVGRVPPMIEPEWVMVAIFGPKLQKGSQKIQLVSRSECWNFWGYGIEIIGAITPKYYKEVPEAIEMPTGERLDILLLLDDYPSITGAD